MSSPEISVIVVSFNSREVLSGCLRSLLRVRDEANFEVILVDNHSTDGSVELVRAEFPDVRVEELPENRGFGAGLNRGFSTARGRFYLILNADTIIPRRTVSKLLQFLKKNPSAGIVGGMLTKPEGMAQDSSFRFPSLPREFLNCLPEIKAILRPRRLAEGITRMFRPPEALFAPQRVECVSGAAFLVRAEVVRELKGFDEGFFLYHEERDFCRRAAQGGWEVWLLPEAQVIHFDAHGTGYRRHRLPLMPVLGWRMAGMDRLWWKHKTRRMHRCWRTQTRSLLRLRMLGLWLSLPLAGGRRSAIRGRIEELRGIVKSLGQVIPEEEPGVRGRQVEGNLP
ncbi:glycosyltransferase family 2 protein [bacterium]|nr:glycosyltransferase family 2 protein [bacterium]MBU1984028.1 glycosyltransferase family 2 protein [bacterium]